MCKNFGEILEYFLKISEKLCRHFGEFLWKLRRNFTEILKKFRGNIEEISRKFFEDIVKLLNLEKLCKIVEKIMRRFWRSPGEMV